VNGLTARQQRWLIALGLLLVGLLLASPALREQRLTAIEPQSSAQATVTAALTASQRAALARDRQLAQTVVAEIAVADAALQPRQPERWAAADYRRYRNQLMLADNHHAASDFSAALAGYRAALETLNGLAAQRPTELGEQLAAAQNHYRTFAAGPLEQSLAIAALLLAEEPSQQAEQLAELRRLQPLLAVTEQAVASVGRLLERGQLDAAEQALQAAQRDVDRDHPALRQTAEQLARQLAARNHQQALDNGYAAIARGALEQAEQAFNTAQALAIDGDAATDGLAMVANQRRQRTIDALLAEAEHYERAERWAQAVATYQQLQRSAPGLLEAQARLLSSGARAEFDQQWQQLVAAPLQLGRGEPRRSAEQWLTDAGALAAAGPRLTEQAERLTALLESAAQARPVTLLSDGETDVTLFRVAKLGRFDRQQLDLLPGHYTALGSCRGRRDNQVSFEVALEPAIQAPLQVEVVCGQPL